MSRSLYNAELKAAVSGILAGRGMTALATIERELPAAIALPSRTTLAKIVIGLGWVKVQRSGNAGIIGQGGFRRRRFSKLIYVDQVLDNWHAMSNWSPFGNAYKYVDWYYAGIRPAFDMEIATKRVIDTTLPAVTARIKANEDTIADLPNRFASAQRMLNIEAAVGAVGGRLSNVEIVTTNGTFATSARAEQIAAYAGGVGAAVDIQAGAIAALNGKAAAYVRIIADAGNGRAVFSLWSDQYGGAWALGGNGQIDGNLTVNGTINARAFNGASMAREASSTWTGSITPASGQTISVPWSLTLPDITPTGRFIYEYTVQLATNAGTSAYGGTDGRGRPITIHYVEDGNSGLRIGATDAQGNTYTPRPNGSQRVLATTVFTPTFTASVSAGSRNETIDDGDNIQRFVSASYTLTRIDLKVTWVAI